MSADRIHSEIEIKALLDELLHLEDSEALFLSVYLDTSVNAEGHRLFPLYLRKKSAELSDILLATEGEGRLREFRENAEAVEAYLESELDKGARGVALFSSVRRGYLRALQFPLPVRNKIVASHAPNLDVLIELAHRNLHYCVVAFDQHSARILSVYLADVRKRRQLESGAPSDEAPSSGASSRLRYEQRLQEHERHFWKELAAAVDKVAREEKPQRVVLIGTQANVAELRKALSQGTERLVALAPGLPPDLADQDLIDRVVAETERRQAEEARQLVDELRHRLAQDYMAVAGVDGALIALQMGRVEALILGAQFSPPGARCQACGSLFPAGTENCSYCPGRTVRVDLRNRMEKLAEQQGVRIEALKERSFLDVLGGVGALLRF